MHKTIKIRAGNFNHPAEGFLPSAVSKSVIRFLFLKTCLKRRLYSCTVHRKGRTEACPKATCYCWHFAFVFLMLLLSQTEHLASSETCTKNLPWARYGCAGQRAGPRGLSVGNFSRKHCYALGDIGWQEQKATLITGVWSQLPSGPPRSHGSDGVGSSMVMGENYGR